MSTNQKKHRMLIDLTASMHSRLQKKFIKSKTMNVKLWCETAIAEKFTLEFKILKGTPAKRKELS